MSLYLTSSLVKLIVDMTTLPNLPSKQILVSALRNTFIGDSKTLKDTADYLAAAASIVGYSMLMMQIVDDASVAIEVKQAALIQLKNQIKLHWQSKKQQMNQGQKQSIKNAILLAVIRCNQNHKLIKLYKEIFTIIVNYQYKNWLPVAAILERINQELDLVPLLHMLLAISSSFQFSISEQQRGYFFDFLKITLPALLQLLSKRQDHELIYLSIKFLWKAVHYQVNSQIKNLACQWMPLLSMVISATNPQFDANPQEIQTRESSQFYYFHSKKWATRILLRFIQKHAKRVSFNKNEDNRAFSESWYKNYGEHMIGALLQQFRINTVKKVRFFQLKCIQICISQRPDIIKQYAQAFQYDILLHFLRLQPEDEQLANREPVQFLSRQSQMCLNFTNLKGVATEAWIGFAELGHKVEKKGHPYEAGVFFFQNMNYLQSKLEGTDPIQKQLAMYLICKLRQPITKSKQVKKLLPILISKYVIPQFQNPIMFLRARAVDIFTEYGSMDLELNVVQQAVQGIYYCLTKDEHSLVRIKAASAFNCILKHSSAKNLVKPLLKQILAVYLQLLEKYDLENIVISLESIVQNFASEISPFAIELIHHLSKLYFKLFNKDIEQNNQEQYDGEAELAAAGCLKTITRIIQSPIPQEIFPRLEIEVIQILQFIFGAEGGEYIEDALVLMNSYLFKAKSISNSLWFFFEVVVYNMVGIPKEMWDSLDNLPLQDKQKSILKNVRSGNNFEMMEQSMPVIRNYIHKASLLVGQPNYEFLKNNLIRLILVLVAQNYKKGTDEFSGEIDITCCTALLVYLLQNFQKDLPEVLYAQMWEIAQANVVKHKSKNLKLLNSQFIAMLVWVAPIQTLTAAHKQNMLPNLLHQLTFYQSKYEFQHQRARVILGINTLLLIPDKTAEILNKIPDLFKVLLKLVKKNAQERLEYQPAQDDEDQEEEQEDLQDFNFDDDDEFWQEQYDDNYAGALDQIDQIALFKQTIEKLNLEQNGFYMQLISIVANEELVALDEKVKKALEKVQKLADSI